MSSRAEDTRGSEVFHLQDAEEKHTHERIPRRMSSKPKLLLERNMVDCIGVELG